MTKLLPSDTVVSELLRERGEMSIAQLSKALEVTATAVRQRLTRLMEHKLVQRQVSSQGRGRPSHQYSLTELGRRQAGSNFADLAVALWQEVRQLPDPEVRRGLLNRIAARLADAYAVSGESVTEKMEAVAEIFGERRVPLTVGANGELPVLTATCCPYPSLAEQDRSICAMEKMMFSEMVGENLHLSACRLDGDAHCQFEISPRLSSS